jgi:hypothetical protein
MMARLLWLNSRSGLTVTIIALIVLSLAPPQLTNWVGALRAPVQTILAPLAFPFAAALRFVNPDEVLRPVDAPALDALRLERDAYLREVNQLRAENDELRRAINELQQGLDLNPNIPVRQFNRPVITSPIDLSSRLLTVRAGTREGVEPTATVAVVRGVHLVGRVIAADALKCQVLPFTDRNAGSIDGVVMLDPVVPGPACRLTPRGDGTLAGRLKTESVLLPGGQASAATDLAGDPAAGVRIGMVVRLADETWPLSAQMLELGVVESVQTPPEDIRIRTIVVRPRYRIDRVSEVTLRVPTSGGERTPRGDGS